MIQIDMQMPKNCCDCPFEIADLINGIITLSCMTQTGRRMYAPGLINEKDRPEWCPLKEQKAKCLTKAELDDLDENQFVWIEGRTGDLFCLQIIAICSGRTGVSDIQFDTPTSFVERSTNTYGKSYRIWTDKPTEEQSQAVKWE